MDVPTETEEPDRFPVAVTLDGVIAPATIVIAGVVVGLATVPENPLAVVTATEVTEPDPPPPVPEAVELMV